MIQLMFVLIYNYITLELYLLFFQQFKVTYTTFFPTIPTTKVGLRGTDPTSSSELPYHRADLNPHL